MTPSFNHAYIQAKLIGELLKNPRYTILSEITLLIENRDYIPDIAIYPKRKPNFYKDIIKLSEMPLGIVEILSPTQGTQEILDKFEIYLKAGIKSCWLVEPVAKAVIVYRNSEESRHFYEKQEIKDEALDIQIPLQNIFE